MNIPTLNKIRIWLAFGVAVVADLLELPITYIESFHFQIIFLFGEFMDIILDFAVMGIMTLLLGWNWAFLPSFFIEVIPEVDICPSWVASVAYVVMQKKKKEQELKQAQTPPATPEADALEVAGEPAAPRPASVDESTVGEVQAPSPADPTMEQRLKKLAELLDKNLISPDEYEAKRQKILVEI
jgi:hypothetical protein